MPLLPPLTMRSRAGHEDRARAAEIEIDVIEELTSIGGVNQSSSGVSGVGPNFTNDSPKFVTPSQVPLPVDVVDVAVRIDRRVRGRPSRCRRR